MIDAREIFDIVLAVAMCGGTLFVLPRFVHRRKLREEETALVLRERTKRRTLRTTARVVRAEPTGWIIDGERQFDVDLAVEIDGKVKTFTTKIFVPGDEEAVAPTIVQVELDPFDETNMVIEKVRGA